MHEMGLADAMMKTVDRILKDEGDVVVRSITVELGDLSGVVPRFLSECWEAVADGTPFAETELILHSVPATARCLDCGETFVVRTDDLRDFRHRVVAGDQVFLGIDIRAVIAGMEEGRGGNPHMDFPGARLPQQGDNPAAGGSADN